MYTEKDRIVIGGRLRKYLIITVILCGIVGALAVLGMVNRSQVLAMTGCVLLFVVFCFMWLMYLYPCIRYRGFLVDMEKGLARELTGAVAEISEKEELQDGVRVYPVKLLMEDDEDGRIVYLNVSKADQFPKAGARVHLNCFGRHIKEVVIF